MQQLPEPFLYDGFAIATGDAGYRNAETVAVRGSKALQSSKRVVCADPGCSFRYLSRNLFDQEYPHTGLQGLVDEAVAVVAVTVQGYKKRLGRMVHPARVVGNITHPGCGSAV